MNLKRVKVSLTVVGTFEVECEIPATISNEDFQAGLNGKLGSGHSYLISTTEGEPVLDVKDNFQHIGTVTEIIDKDLEYQDFEVKNIE